MEDREVRDTLHRLIRECSEDVEQLPDLMDETEIDALQFDSLKLIQLVFELEMHYDIEIEEHRLLRLETVGDLVRLIQGSPTEAA